MWADPSTVQVLAEVLSVNRTPLQVKGCHVRGCLLLCRYQLMLVAKGGDLLFNILETSAAKQLPHITLAFKRGNDMAIKQVCGKEANLMCKAFC